MGILASLDSGVSVSSLWGLELILGGAELDYCILVIDGVRILVHPGDAAGTASRPVIRAGTHTRLFSGRGGIVFCAFP